MQSDRSMVLGVDTGGTFTDFVLWRDGRIDTYKTLSTPDDPSRSIFDGIVALGLEEALARGELAIVHGSTVATNAALEGKGARTAFVTNRGFTDILRIGRQARRELYDLHPSAPPDPVPSELSLGTGGRIDVDGNEIEPLTAQDLNELRERIIALAPEAVAVTLLHSYRDDRNELRIEAALRDLAFVSRSSFVLPEYREYERGIATWLNAWLSPVIERYLSRLIARTAPSRVAVMQSSGVVIDAAAASRRAVNLLVSGPAGGLAAATFLGGITGSDALLTFDMGGTSTDVALIQGRPRLTDEGRIGPYPVAIPMADIHTIGAGGGSIAWLDAGGALQVGPASAGAAPGPACYGRGGTQPTVTDANVLLGRLPPATRLAGNLALDAAAAARAIDTVARPLGRTTIDTARGIVALANQHMAQALRLISLERGYDPRRFTLVCFGGAGGLHVCALATALSIQRILVPAHAGVFSALGMVVAEPGRQLSRTLNLPFDDAHTADIVAGFDALAEQGRVELESEGHPRESIQVSTSVDLRYRGQSYSLTLRWAGTSATLAAFHARHEQRYGHAFSLPVELVNVRAELTVPRPALPLPRHGALTPDSYPGAEVAGLGSVRVIAREALRTGEAHEGPLVILDSVATTFVDPGWRATMDEWGSVELASRERGSRETGAT
jgi:N-methylhydantoinase A